MSKARTIGISISALTLSAGFIGLGLFLSRQGLDRADKWASVASIFVGLVSLIVTSTPSVRRSSEPEQEEVPESMQERTTFNTFVNGAKVSSQGNDNNFYINRVGVVFPFLWRRVFRHH
jgi:hypothetical protein